MSEKDVERIARVLAQYEGLEPGAEVITFDGGAGQVHGTCYILAEGHSPRPAWQLFLSRAWLVFYELEARPLGWEAPERQEPALVGAEEDEQELSWEERHGLYSA